MQVNTMTRDMIIDVIVACAGIWGMHGGQSADGGWAQGAGEVSC